MDINHVTLGTRLTLEVLDSENEKAGQSYTSQLIETVDQENIYITCPIYQSRYVIFEPDTGVKILFLDSGNQLISFEACITAKKMSGNILLLKAAVTGNMKKTQRRSFYRLDCCMEVKYRHCKGDVERPTDVFISGEYKKALTKNISGNGACILTDEEISEGSVIELEIFLDPSDPLKLKSEVIRNKKIEGRAVKKYESGIFFSEILPRHQDKVVKYIFSRQRQML